MFSSNMRKQHLGRKIGGQFISELRVDEGINYLFSSSAFSSMSYNNADTLVEVPLWKEKSGIGRGDEADLAVFLAFVMTKYFEPI